MLLNCGVGETLESPLDCKEIWSVRHKGYQSWVFIGGPDVEAETQYFGHLMWRADSFEKTLVLGKIEGRRRNQWLRMRWLDGISDMMDMSLSTLWKLVMDREAWHAAVHEFTRLSDWTDHISRQRVVSSLWILAGLVTCFWSLDFCAKDTAWLPRFCHKKSCNFQMDWVECSFSGNLGTK